MRASVWISEGKREQSAENILPEETVSKVPEAADKKAEVGEMKGQVEWGAIGGPQRPAENVPGSCGFCEQPWE